MPSSRRIRATRFPLTSHPSRRITAECADSRSEDASRLAPALPCGCAGSPGSIGRFDSNLISRVSAPDRPLPLFQYLLPHSSSPPVVFQTGSPLSCVDLFENVNLHRLVGHQTLEPRVLFFECSESVGFAEFHPSKLPLPRVVGRRSDIVRRTDRLYRARPSSSSAPF
jgi:hypothetical protein